MVAIDLHCIVSDFLIKIVKAMVYQTTKRLVLETGTFATC